MAAAGATAIAEIQFADYIFPAFDQVKRNSVELYKKACLLHTASGKLKSDKIRIFQIFFCPKAGNFYLLFSGDRNS